MRRFPSPLPLIAVAVVFCLAGSLQGQQSGASQTGSSLGVSLEVAAGRAIAFPVQAAGSSEDKLPVIPMPGHKKVSGVRIYPFMSGDQVAVRVAAMLPAKSSRSPKIQRVGEYVIGHLGDSLKLTQLTKLGLRPLAVTVVAAPFVTDAAEDPCCILSNGLECCAPTIALLCADCPDCCALFKAQYPRSSQTRCPNKNPAATPNLKSRLAVNQSK